MLTRVPRIGHSDKTTSTEERDAKVRPVSIIASFFLVLYIIGISLVLLIVYDSSLSCLSNECTSMEIHDNNATMI